MQSRLSQHGFSMTEVVFVLTILLILSGLALPQLLNTLYMSRARGAASDLSGLVQQARIMSERQSTTLPVYAGTVETNATGAFIGVNGSTWQNGDPDVPYASGVSNAAASSAPAALNPGFTAETDGTILYFSPRGLAVKSSGSTYVPSAGVIFYITDTHQDWAAVSVSGTGRSKVWTWNGSAWH